MPSALGWIGWFFLIAAPVTFFERLISLSILNWIYGIVAAIGAMIIGIVLLTISNTPLTTQEVTYYSYWCIAAGILIAAGKFITAFRSSAGTPTT
jgi:hypothetical protein